MSKAAYLQDAGWNSKWDAETRDECLEHHRKLYRELKQEHGGRTTPVDEIPGLLEGVESLLEYGYSLTDVGVMLGVTRERVRQWVERYDLNCPHFQAQYRIWDDDKNRFITVSHEDMKEQARLMYMERAEAEREHDMALRWNKAITTARRLAREKGRAPTLFEVCCELSGYEKNEKAVPVALQRLIVGAPGQNGADSYAEISRHLFELASLPMPKRGGAGHRDKRPVYEEAS